MRRGGRGGCGVLSELNENRASYQFEVNPSGRNENIFQYLEYPNFATSSYFLDMFVFVGHSLHIHTPLWQAVFLVFT